MTRQRGMVEGCQSRLHAGGMLKPVAFWRDAKAHVVLDRAGAAAASQIPPFAPLTARLGNCAPFLCYYSAGRAGNVIVPTGFPDTSDCAGPENPAGSMKDGSGPDGAPNNNAKKAHFRQLWHQFGAFWCVFVLFFGGRTG